MFDAVRIITSKQEILSVRSNADPPIFKKIAVRSSPDPEPCGPWQLNVMAICARQE